MFAFIIRRITQAIFVMLVISMVGFAIKNKIGDPVRDLVGERVTPEERAQIRDQLGLNDPFAAQYLRFLKNVTKGDLGQSFFYKKPALDVIVGKAPATLELVFGAALIIILVSMPLGVYTALKPQSAFSRFVMGFSTLGVSMPVFLTAIMLIYVFGVNLHWLPSYGRGETVDLFGNGWWQTGFLTLDGLEHLILPCISLASIMLPLFIRLIRSEMMEVLETEYIKYAWAKGLSPMRIWLVHAFKNTLLPVVTVFGVQIGIMFAFTILTETVFQWQGMGYMFLEAVERSDISLLIAYLIVVGSVFVLVNTLVDILYGFINPTVRIAGRK
ncbi:peptide/nickel transport system permease protein [Desulfocicer vacuolatum DSM 3385]|uniref:Peptide/nickel transport system permease protein n=1 Tax=Desulfocicer vacuolatum DSM 3385 TaxID=1121400 RepID=A0A1W2E4A6_9BACT|nr:ABC transporter permease [Desulfocicer vacuolatum]SMD04590.1 peptide/nickel transport system permease protein [Desulfocicer vacuolatum DSM 3385]